MRDYYDALGLNRDATAEQIQQAIDSITPAQLADEGDLQAIMQNDSLRKHYQRVHLQYEAIAAAMSSTGMTSAENSHSWDKRVVEFVPEQDTIELQRTR